MEITKYDPFVPGFCSTSFTNSSILLYALVVCSFYDCIVFHCMDIPPFLIQIPVDRPLAYFDFELFMNKTVTNIYNKSFCKHKFSFVLGNLGVEWLNCLINVYFFIKKL